MEGVNGKKNRTLINIKFIYLLAAESEDPLTSEDELLSQNNKSFFVDELRF